MAFITCIYLATRGLRNEYVSQLRSFVQRFRAFFLPFFLQPHLFFRTREKDSRVGVNWDHYA